MQYEGLEGVSRIFPEVLTALIAAGGVYFVGKSLWRRARQGGRPEIEEVAWPKVGIICVTALIYAVLIPVLGFLSATVLFIFGSTMILGDLEPWPAASGKACGRVRRGLRRGGLGEFFVAAQRAHARGSAVLGPGQGAVPFGHPVLNRAVSSEVYLSECGACSGEPATGPGKTRQMRRRQGSFA